MLRIPRPCSPFHDLSLAFFMAAAGALLTAFGCEREPTTALPVSHATDAAVTSTATAENIHTHSETSPTPQTIEWGWVSDGQITLTDDAGRTHTLEPGATRIVALAPFAADLLAELGRPPAAAALAPSQLDDPRWADTMPLKVSHSAGPVLEELVAASPDLVLTTSAFARFTPAIERITQAPVVCLDVASITGLAERAELIGILAGAPDAAGEWAVELRDAITADETVAAESPKVLALFGAGGGTYAFLPDSYLGSVVERLGGRVVTGGGKPHAVFSELTSVGLEGILAADPDVILLVDHGAAAGRLEELRSNSAWSTLRAVRDGRVEHLPEWMFIMAVGSRPIEAAGRVRDALLGMQAEAHHTP